MSKVEQEMQLLIEEQRQSGLSIKRFCRERSVNYSTFNYYHRKLRQSEFGSFLSVNTRGKNGAPSPIEFIYPNGIKIRMEEFNLNQIYQLLKLS